MDPSARQGAFVLRSARSDDLESLVRIDDEASTLYARHGISIELSSDHPFVLAERDRWARAIALRAAFVAESLGEAVGFVALRHLDAQPYLDQVSVRPSHGRRGCGRALVQCAAAWARAQGGRRLWLTTYAHVPWNAPFYARMGFAEVAPVGLGPEMYAVLEAQRAVLAAPERRIAMALQLDVNRQGKRGC